MRQLTPTEKGAIAEAKITAAAVELGIVVLRPTTEGRRYDLVLDTGARLWRVQCKWGTRKHGVVAVRTSTSRHTPGGYIRTTYRASEIDGIAIYCRATETCYFLPIALVAGKTFIHLRVEPAKNNQRVCVNLCADYPLGAIAQLGERVTGSHEVAGSSPASSI
jgi:hypothetical protein